MQPPGGGGLPGLGILQGWSDCGGTSGPAGVSAFARVEGAVGSDTGDLLFGSIARNLTDRYDS